MEKLLKCVTAVFIFVLIVQSGCNQKPPSESSSKSGTMLLTVSTSNPGNETTSDIPVSDGVLAINKALIYVDEIGIEENFGFDGEQEGEKEGEHDDGDQDGNNENEDEEGEIELTGPFTLDVSDGKAFIDTVKVYPGTFTKVEIEFIISDEDPFLGNSIVISGEFSPEGDKLTPIPFNLFSSFSEEIEVSLAQGTIDVQEEETISVTIVFDFSQWFAGMNFATADLIEGKIIVDSQNNTNLLTIFENNLSENIEVEEDEDND